MTRLLVAVAAISLVPALAGAPAAWERVQALGPNQAVTVYLRTGEPVKGKLQTGLSSDLSCEYS